MKDNCAPLLFVLAGLLAGCANNPKASSMTLKDAFKDHFLVGAALNDSQCSGTNAAQVALITQQFNSITPENVLKWDSIHPKPETYNFEPGDRYVAFGRKHNMFIIGHTLVWHNQTPKWVFENDGGGVADRETLLARMRDHISTVVGRYKGQVNGWDVVNEVLNDDGTLRDSPWLKIIGEDYIAKAFEFAHEADPQAELYINEFSLENTPKRDGAIALLKKLKAGGAPVSAIGSQDHVKMDWPAPAQIEAMVGDFSRAGVKVMITELDVDLLPPVTHSRDAEVSLRVKSDPAKNPYTNGLPDSVQQQLAARYAELFAAYLKYPGAVSRVTFWGVTDGDSWLNTWPAKGRTSYPLLFGRDCRPKPAFAAVLQTAN